MQTIHDPESLSPLPLCFMSFLFSSANQGNSSLLWRNSLLHQTTTKSLKIPMTKYWPIAIALHISPTRGHGVDNQCMNRRAEHVHLHVMTQKYKTKQNKEIIIIRLTHKQFSHLWSLKANGNVAMRSTQWNDLQHTGVVAWHSEWNISGASASK